LDWLCFLVILRHGFVWKRNKSAATRRSCCYQSSNRLDLRFLRDVQIRISLRTSQFGEHPLGEYNPSNGEHLGISRSYRERNENCDEFPWAKKQIRIVRWWSECPIEIVILFHGDTCICDDTVPWIHRHVVHIIF